MCIQLNTQPNTQSSSGLEYVFPLDGMLNQPQIKRLLLKLRVQNLGEHISYAQILTTQNLVFLHTVVFKLQSVKLQWNVMGIHNFSPE